jgi:hypothetical protein
MDQNYIDMPKIIIFQKITCAKKFVSARSTPSEVSDQLIEALIGGENFFFSKWVMSGIKMSVFLRRFQKYKLTLGTKCV